MLGIFTYGQAQEKEKENFTPSITTKWAPTGLSLGSLSLQGEYNMGKSSLTAKIGLPAGAKYIVDYDNNDANFTLKATSFLAGYRMYLSKRHMRGLYFEPFLKYVHHIAEGKGTSTIGFRKVVMEFDNEYDAFGIGAQLGAQFFIGKRFVIDLFFLGPEINAASNKFRTIETSNAIPWTMVEAQDAERDIREFVDDIPFIRNKTKINVDRENRSVQAEFKGALPGFRTGISFGIAF
jgi:hypothetical protein